MPARSEPAAPPTTQDSLLDGRVRLRQPVDGYRVAIDPVLLAAAVAVRPGDHVVDLGTGVGAAALCLLARAPDCRVTGIEIQTEYAELARSNAALNGFDDRSSVIQLSISDIGAQLHATADHVMANPPYLPPERAAPSHLADAATVEGAASLAVWVDAAMALVRPKGSVTFIQRADRLDALLAAMRQAAGEIVICPLWPKQGRPAKRILVRARKGVASPLRLSSGLVLHNDDGSYTQRADGILRAGAALDLSAP